MAAMDATVSTEAEAGLQRSFQSQDYLHIT